MVIVIRLFAFATMMLSFGVGDRISLAGAGICGVLTFVRSLGEDEDS